MYHCAPPRPHSSGHTRRHQHHPRSRLGWWYWGHRPCHLLYWALVSKRVILMLCENKGMGLVQHDSQSFISAKQHEWVLTKISMVLLARAAPSFIHCTPVICCGYPLVMWHCIVTVLPSRVCEGPDTATDGRTKWKGLSDVFILLKLMRMVGCLWFFGDTVGYESRETINKNSNKQLILVTYF